ncbi:MAG: 3-methyl-2-oxobutanoate hydroxymethyltransferase [Candidatus Synechococcus spongiarum 142]|uniref:3-methyl-2-oxobutanoate hydroxymethyltransferase n=1 Tax=Candidatus Synechococcus spongiarum 142 TaxID=1608213 RepID=A0A6N3X891_9SYNE|nr:MAG: 3-methyl-2-oxobutanoate hydroxymethyltransferase [Candidatus Synechococcus spongiarum 142]
MPLTIRDLQNYKRQGRIITALTAWDALSGAWVDASGCDMALVGDSLAMVSLGHATTLPVSLGAMVHHAQAVGRTIHRPLLVADLPFLSYQCGTEQAVAAAGRFLKETPCQAVKLEGAEPETLAVISRLVRTGIPVMGHLGLTPQSVHRLGWGRQACSAPDQERLRQKALDLQQQGCFALVLEHIPAVLASRLRQELDIPVIGIGAGPDCDGQILVTADLLGLTNNQPPFVKPRLQATEMFKRELQGWCHEQRRQEQTAHPPKEDNPPTPDY